MRLLFVIRSLDTGGAERQLVQLCRGLVTRGAQVAVAVLYSGGVLERELEGESGVVLLRLDKKSRWDTVGFSRRALQLARQFRPDMVHGYMSGANELALLIGKSLNVPVVWGIRVSDQDFGDYSLFRQGVFHLGRMLSRAPHMIIANSHRGRRFHIDKGYPSQSFEVIPNGIDLERFRPDRERGAAWRSRHGIDLEASVVILPARLDPMKDHVTFVDAMAALASHRQDVRFIALGNGSDAARESIVAHARARGVDQSLTVMPAETRVEDAYNAATLVTLTSAFGEGFPNVLGEAMACARVCVSTDVGDSAVVLGDVGRVVPIRAPIPLAEAWQEMLSLDAVAMAALECSARARMEANFGIDLLLDLTVSHFEKVLRRGVSSEATVSP